MITPVDNFVCYCAMLGNPWFRIFFKSYKRIIWQRKYVSGFCWWFWKWIFWRLIFYKYAYKYSMYTWIMRFLFGNAADSLKRHQEFSEDWWRWKNNDPYLLNQLSTISVHKDGDHCFLCCVLLQIFLLVLFFSCTFCWWNYCVSDYYICLDYLRLKSLWDIRLSVYSLKSKRLFFTKCQKAVVCLCFQTRTNQMEPDSTSFTTRSTMRSSYSGSYSFFRLAPKSQAKLW